MLLCQVRDPKQEMLLHCSLLHSASPLVLHCASLRSALHVTCDSGRIYAGAHGRSGMAQALQQQALCETCQPVSQLRVLCSCGTAVASVEAIAVSTSDVCCQAQVVRLHEGQRELQDRLLSADQQLSECQELLARRQEEVLAARADLAAADKGKQTAREQIEHLEAKVGGWICLIAHILMLSLHAQLCHLSICAPAKPWHGNSASRQVVCQRSGDISLTSTSRSFLAQL